MRGDGEVPGCELERVPATASDVARPSVPASDGTVAAVPGELPFDEHAGSAQKAATATTRARMQVRKA